MPTSRHSFSATPPGGLTASDRLAVYGSLAPGEANAELLEPLAGSWCDGQVRGTLHPVGWGAALGYRAIRLDQDAPEIPVRMFSSPGLRAFWDRLDAFEGEDYERTIAQVRVGGELFDANIYCSRKTR